MIMAYLSIYRTPRDGDRPSTDKMLGFIGAVAAIYFTGRLIYDIYEEIND